MNDTEWVVSCIRDIEKMNIVVIVVNVILVTNRRNKSLAVKINKKRLVVNNKTFNTSFTSKYEVLRVNVLN